MNATGFVLREILRAVERHVLDEVGQSALVIIFENGSGFHYEPKLSALLGFLVRENVIAQPVGETCPS